MKTASLMTFALISALFLAPPVTAQQGPAGVPGAALLGAEIVPPPPPPEPVTLPAPTQKRIVANCRQAKNVERCEARLAARAEARQACKNKAKELRPQCVKNYLAAKK